MSKRKDPPGVVRTELPAGNPPDDGGGCGFCLLNLSLMLAAPAAVVALASVGRKGWSSARTRARLRP